jgi:hypothetical protein
MCNYGFLLNIFDTFLILSSGCLGCFAAAHLDVCTGWFRRRMHADSQLSSERPGGCQAEVAGSTWCEDLGCQGKVGGNP